MLLLFSYATVGDVRLVGGATDSEGRVEVYDNGAWGTVCDDSWDVTDAGVVCRQLGYRGATSAPREAFFGAGSGSIYYDEVACTGSEARLVDCSHSALGVHNCNHNEDAGVVCDTSPGQLYNYGYLIILAQMRITDCSLLFSVLFVCQFHWNSSPPSTSLFRITEPITL